MREAIEGRRSSRRVLTLMPMLPSGLTSGRSLCVEPATPMSAPGWRSATRARGGVRRRDSPAPNLCDDLRYFAVQGKSSLLLAVVRGARWLGVP